MISIRSWYIEVDIRHVYLYDGEMSHTNNTYDKYVLSYVRLYNGNLTTF